MSGMRHSGPWIGRFLIRERLTAEFRELIERVHVPLAERIAAAAYTHGSCLTVGLCGAQGSGKSTMAAVLCGLLTNAGVTASALSLDDFYLPRAARLELARRVHPLLQTRGVPGTHEVPLALQVHAALREPGTIALPAFDKAQDERRLHEQWAEVRGPAQVILLEGWCVGAIAQSPDELVTPVNTLEAEEDPRGIWRRYVNDALAGEYRSWFGQIDFLILLQAPGFEVVHRWRLEQEHKLRERLHSEGGDPGQVMDDRGIARFISHYERLTRHIHEKMPARADVVLELDEQRRPRETGEV